MGKDDKGNYKSIEGDLDVFLYKGYIYPLDTKKRVKRKNNAITKRIEIE